MSDPSNESSKASHDRFRSGSAGDEPRSEWAGATEVDDEISLLDVGLILARNVRLIAVCTLAFTFLGLVYSVVASEEYTSRAKLVREATADLPGGLPGGLSALRGLGISLGGAGSGLTPEAYPAILSSREVRLAVARDTLYYPSLGRRTTFVQYYDESAGWLTKALKGVEEYTVGLPGKILRAVQGTPARRPQTGERTYPTETEENAILLLGEMLSTQIDTETGLMSLAVTAEHPRLASDLANVVIKHLSERVRELRTEKARRDLEFARTQFEEAQEALLQAEERLAAFTDRNRSLNSASLQTQRDRLQRQVRFKSNLYSELQAQVTQAELNLQRSEPVVTLVEEPAPPLEKSAPQRKLIVIGAFLFGGILGVAIAFVQSHLMDSAEDQEEREKMEEIQSVLKNPLDHLLNRDPGGGEPEGDGAPVSTPVRAPDDASDPSS